MSDKVKTYIADIQDFKPDSENTNRHTLRGRSVVQKGMEERGYARPAFAAKDGTVLGGNLSTMDVAVDIGLGDGKVLVVESDGTIPIIHKRIDVEPGSKEAKLLAIEDNRSAELSLDWNPEQLAADLSAGLDLSGIFDTDELEGIIGQALNGKGGDTPPQIDQAAKLAEKWGVQVGQVWQLGPHRVACGDCTDRAVVEGVMRGERAALCVTDPPYGVNYDPQWRVGLGGGGKQDFANGRVIDNDNTLEWVVVFEFLPCDVLYCWTAALSAVQLINNLQKYNFCLLYLIIWNKDLAVFGRGDYHHKHEPCLYMVRNGKNHNWHGGRKQETVWNIPTIHSFANGHNSDEWGLVGHGNQKPLECMARPIQNNSIDGETIIDPFLGSGTTLIACHNLNRVCRGIELDAGYVGVTLQRFFDHTGIEPVLMDN